MRRSNLIVGLALSAVGHGVLFVVLTRGAPPPKPQPARRHAAPVQIASSMTPEELMPMEPAPEPAPQPPAVPAAPIPDDPAPALARAPSAPPETPPMGPLAPVVQRRQPDVVRPEPRPARKAAVPQAVAADAAPQPSSEPAGEAPGLRVADAERPGRTPDDGDAEYVPPLRVHWRDAGELIDVARALGLRLAAVGRGGEIVAEVALTEAPSLREWAGLPWGYSNRVRMLSPSIFSSRLGPEIREIWVFVPSDRDRAMLAAQREAVRRAGGRPEDVAAIDGRFVRAANGSYRLDITNIRWRGDGSGNG